MIRNMKINLSPDKYSTFFLSPYVSFFICGKINGQISFCNSVFHSLCFSSFIEMYIIYLLIHPFKMYNSVVFVIFIELYNYHHKSILYFNTPPKNPLCLVVHHSLFLLPPPPICLPSAFCLYDYIIYTQNFF